MPPGAAAQQTVLTGRRHRAGGKETDFTTRRSDMNKIKALFSTLALSLLLAGSALASEKVNINTADAATLDRVLHNVGAAKAEAIVAHRKANGPFQSPEQLAQVKGIGLRTVEQNRDRIVVSAAAAKPAAAAPASRTAAQTR